MGKGSVTSTSATSQPVPAVKKDVQLKAEDRKHSRLPKPSFPKPSFTVSPVNGPASAVTSVPPAISNATSRTSTAKIIALPANCADAHFIYNLIGAAAAAASSAAAEAVTGALRKAYNIPLTTVTTTAEQDLLELSLKDCTMDEKWNCGNKALKGKKGWIHTKAGGWRKVCQQCKQHLEYQQKISDRTGLTPIDS